MNGMAAIRKVSNVFGRMRNSEVAAIHLLAWDQKDVRPLTGRIAVAVRRLTQKENTAT